MIPARVWLFWFAAGCCLLPLALLIVGSRSLSWVFDASRTPRR